MKGKALLLLPVLLLAATVATAQEPAGDLKGNVVERATRRPVDGARVIIGTPVPVETTTTGGVFVLRGLPPGTWELTVEAPDCVPVRLSAKVVGGAETEVLTVSLSPALSANTDASDVEFDTDLGDLEQDLPVTLSATGDVFENIASYNFGILRFRNRGYDNSTTQVLLNGIAMNDAQSGYSPWSLWGGLNDATRNQESTSGLHISDLNIGSINGVTNINATASQVRKGFRASAVNASGQYLFRGMLTYASGFNDNGWAYAFSLSTRQGGNLWVNGVDYNAWGYFASIEKKLNPRSSLALTLLGAPTVRSVQAASTQEVYDLVGSHYYNPNWGYQNGEMRNARIRDNHEPVLMLNYTNAFNDRHKLLIGASYRFGTNGYSSLDWYDAQDPRPDYYRYLPSYFSRNPNPSYIDPTKAAWLAEGWASDWNIRQINWDAMYDVNRHSYFDDATAVAGTTPATRRSKYVVGEFHTDQQDINATAQWIGSLTNRLKFTAGIEYRWNRTEYFKQMKDLLGGEYWLDIDQFAERDFGDGSIVQNDLNNPNRLIREGDKYGYDYYSFFTSERLWATLQYHYGAWEMYAAAERGHTNFYRDGRYRKGLFPDNSYGKSDERHFGTGAVKIGATYKISGSHRLWFNAAYLHEAPHFQRSMVSPRTRNDFVPGLTTIKTASVDINYALRLPWIKMRATGYYTTIRDMANVISFYDDLHRTFANFAMSGIDQRHTGIETGIEIPLLFDITLTGALSYGYYIYTSNPTVTATADNNSRPLYGDVETETVYWKNYKISGTPQTALDIGLDYRSRRNLFLSIDLGYFDANYISMNPARRTDPTVAILAMDGRTEDIYAMTRQERFPAAVVLNANIGKYWIIGKYMLGVNLDLKNILNNTDIISGGYEQMRLRRDTSVENRTTYSPFDSKYFYLFGTTYYLNVYLRF
ncbi:MAG: carboxypeptidase-like regulatory domain-containing protein [Prevotellaceae bacterium]|jgi:hypothetical protein|nr:carboxypeptidase-like regulatory domain-containing protein [Prevotellaceae bacterium]